MTNKKEEQSPKLKEVLIPKYELDWTKLKAWLDARFASYKCTFTERYNVVRLHLTHGVVIAAC